MLTYFNEKFRLELKNFAVMNTLANCETCDSNYNAYLSVNNNYRGMMEVLRDGD